MIQNELKNLIAEAEELLKNDGEHYSDMSKELLSYQIQKTTEVLNSGDERLMKFAYDGNGWKLLHGLKNELALFREKRCLDLKLLAEQNEQVRKKKAVTGKDYTKPEEYIFFSAEELAEIKNNLKQPLLNTEWERIQKLADEYDYQDTMDIADSMKSWRWLPFKFRSLPDARYAKISFQSFGGEVYLDKVSLAEPATGVSEIPNTMFEGAKLVSSNRAETYGSKGRLPVTDVIALSGEAEIRTRDFQSLHGDADYTLNVYIKQENWLKAPLNIKVLFYDDARNLIQEELYEWNRLTHIRWDYIFERSSADAVVFLLTDRIEYAKKTVNELIYMLQDMKNTGILYWLENKSKPFDDGYGTVHMGRAMAGLCVMYDIIRKHPSCMTAEQKAQIEEGIYFIADYLGQFGLVNRGLEYLPELAEKFDPQGGNWAMDQFMGLGYFAATFPDHPLHFVYLENSKLMVQGLVEKMVTEEGVWPESMRYHFAVLQGLALYAIMLKRYDGTDYTLNRTFKRMYQYALETQLPQYIYQNNEISHLVFGDDKMGTGNNFFHFNMASKLFRDTDPEFSERLLTTWKKAGGYIAFGGLNGWLLPFIMIDFSTQPREKVGGLHSVCYPKFGVAVMRNDAETERDTHVTVICSQNGGGHGHFDLGSFSYFANAVPLSLDPGVQSYWDNSFNWYRSSAAHSTLQFDGQNVLNQSGLALVLNEKNGIRHFESKEAFDYAVIEVYNPGGSGRQIRHVILDKVSNSLIVYDKIEDFDGQTTFNLPLCSKETAVSGTNIFAKGHFDTDIAVNVMLPENPEISLSKGSVSAGSLPVNYQDYVRISGHGTDEFLVIITPVRGNMPKVSVTKKDDVIRINENTVELYQLD